MINKHINYNEFVHLKIHSEYSLIDSTIKINNLIKKAIFYNMKSLAISDFSNFFGLIKFYESCCLNNIKPIIGIDILIDHKDEYHITNLTLFAINNDGYKNLILIISKSYNNIRYKFPIVNYEILIKYNKGIIILSGGIYSYLGKILFNNDKKKLIKYLNLYLKIFYDRFYIEISRLNNKNEELYINKCLNISKKFSLPLVATNNVVFLNKNDFKIHNIRVKINEKNNFYNKKEYTNDQYFKSQKEMLNLFIDIPESIINSIEISKKCNVIINFNNHYIPKFYKKIENTSDFIKKISKKLLNNKLHNLFSNINERLKFQKIYENRLYKELLIINKMKFQDYFLIVMEFINWSKKNNIAIGPGRGSGTGSLVSFVLGITELDPIRFGLIFERFLNPNRISMPDLDIDFCVEKRDLVINHIIKKYGKDNVSQIITFNKMTAKSAIKDVGRSLKYPYNFINNISKIIPNFQGFNLIDAFKIYEFKKLYNNDEDVKYIIDISIKLEGIVKNIGKHAGGIVISPFKMIKLIPLYFNDINNCSITQFDKDDIEKIGLIKFDFLGLKTLSIIDRTINSINKKSEKKIDIKKISLNDKKSFKMLNFGLTNAVFQLESKGIKNIIRKLKPNSFEDIIALIALFRPGPLKSGMVNNFINRKNNFEKVYYPNKNMEHKILKEILYPTYGIILYQEQIIKIAQKFSNYSLSEADLFRIAISKKKPLEMKKQKKKFISGSIIKNNINKKLSENIFNIIEKFSGYGFNKSHSAAYALIAYRTLWLKSNYTKEFMSEVMNLDINNYEKILNLIKECKKLKIKINNIDINKSNYEFYVNEKNEIEYGIGSIKGIGENSVKEIIKNRNQYGEYKNIIDLITRVNIHKIGKKNIEILINNEAFKSLNIKNYIEKEIDKYIKISKKHFEDIKNNQIDMFGIL